MVRSPSTRGARPASRPSPLTKVAPLAVGVAYFALCLAFVPHAAGDGDAGELVAVLGTLGLAHPTGYVPWTLSGHAWVRGLHALGADWAWAANAWSALAAAVAAGAWYALAARALRDAGVRASTAALGALFAVALAGLGPFAFAAATLVEVHAAHAAWLALASTLAVAIDARAGALRTDRRAQALACLAWGLVVGAGLAHHATSVFLAVPVTIALLARVRPGAPGLAAGCVGAALPLVLGWGGVYWRALHPAGVQWGALLPTARSAWDHVTAAGYHHYLGRYAPAPQVRAALATGVYPWLALALASLALRAASPGARDRVLRIAFLAAGVAQTVYVFGYGVPDPGPYFLPPLALGLAFAPAAVAGHPSLRRAASALAGLAGVLAVVLAATTLREAAERRVTYERADAFLRDMWAHVPLARGFVLWDDDMSGRLVAYQRLDGVHPGLVVVQPRLLMDDGARRRFAKAYGFDPLGRAAPPAEDVADQPAVIAAFAAAVADSINAATRDSVVLFEPATPALRVLRKGPAPVSAEAGQPAADAVR